MAKQRGSRSTAKRRKPAARTSAKRATRRSPRARATEVRVPPVWPQEAWLPPTADAQPDDAGATPPAPPTRKRRAPARK